ncbi:26S proteasome regulatory complex, non-ATPase subcomplex, Rpn1 subunit [Exidia glandulosa HHB12029]|uniref:26S proteasome regulatory subunit RPN1 n=1 Tax=Exidia glandulosa HHB12029 TaxID=1314781 RepID=A0A165DRE4_EXIGL|nr:26S proteasome regulatory complex, non-ATPase subcomplex, Rpn1 subunit [Exidia glandulosa HHB12029]
MSVRLQRVADRATDSAARVLSKATSREVAAGPPTLAPPAPMPALPGHHRGPLDALETHRTLIRTSTSSMTSVPKPLKFLRPHYPDLQTLLFADILLCLAMTYSDTDPRGTLRYRLLSSSATPPGLWGHEYVRHLAAELGEEYTICTETPEVESIIAADTEELRTLAMECTTFLLQHNAEADAVDLLEELEIVERIVELVDKDTFARVCLYMVSCVHLLAPPDDVAFLRTAHQIYLTQSKFPEALALAIRLGDQELVRADFNAPGNPTMKRQLAFLLARAHVPLEWVSPQPEDESEEELPEDLITCLSNTTLTTHFKAFGKELNVVEPKSLEDIYKSHLENTRSTANVDSARANLAGTFVNAFVNAGFGNDKFMVDAPEGQSWVYKNKDNGMLSAAASLGLSLLWDVDGGVNHTDKYSYSSEEYIKAGALLATGILHCGIKSDVDAAVALLAEYVENPLVSLKTSAIVGLSLAHVSSQRENIMELLLPLITDENNSTEIVNLASLALGFVFVGSCRGEITSTILQTLMEHDDAHLDESQLAKQAQILVEVCAFAGSGNVLKVQSMLHHCSDHLDKEKEEDAFQSFAVLCIPSIAMGDGVGAEISLRHSDHLMHYREPVIRKSIPLALGLLSASNPQLNLLDTLSRYSHDKYSHDNDMNVALNAIFAMGIVGAGSNNTRLAQMLLQLAGYYHKVADCLFMVRIAQGLLHMGKGTIGVNPFFGDRQCMSRPAVAGLLAAVVAFTDPKQFVLEKAHWMLYFLAIDVVGQAGKPRTISGFQTHSTHLTPARLGTTERAELATEEFVPYASVLEGLVILAKKTAYESKDKMEHQHKIILLPSLSIALYYCYMQERANDRVTCRLCEHTCRSR